MRPIFKYEIDFLKEKLNIDIPENKCWMDKMIIYGFDNDFNKVKLFRMRARQMELSLVKDYGNKNIKLSTYDDLINNHRNKLNQLENKSLEIINTYLEEYKNRKIYICFSGGKDSIVTNYLVHKINNTLPVIYNNTTIDAPQNTRYVKTLPNIHILNPKQGFHTWRKNENFVPTRFSRVCCRIFKEEAMYNFFNKDEEHLFFYGMRASESNTRSDYDFEWYNINWSTDKWMGVLPIVKWTDLDLWLYMFKNNLYISDVYKFGYGRMGCTVVCPFESNYNNVLDKHWFPKQYNNWQRILKEDFISGNKWINLNCTLDEYLKGAWKGGLYRKEANEKVVSEFAQYENITYDEAKQYFDQKCECGKKLKYDIIKLNLQNKNKELECKKCLNKQ